MIERDWKKSGHDVFLNTKGNLVCVLSILRIFASHLKQFVEVDMDVLCTL